MMIDRYQYFFQESALKKAKAYQDDLLKKIQKDYGYGTAPLILNPERYHRIIDKTHALVAFLNSEKYYNDLSREFWFLDQNPMKKNDFFGCIDFMLTPSGEEKLQELVAFPSGRLGVLGPVNDTFKQYYPEWAKYSLDKDLDHLMVKSVTENYKYRNIAIAVNHLPSSKDQFTQYHYVAKTFQRYGINACVHFAKDIQVSTDGTPSFEGKSYDRVFNLLIPLIWEWHQKEFTAYTEFFNQFPEKMLPNPLGMRMGNKSILAKLWQDDLQEYGLDDANIEMIKDTALRTAPLSQFSSVKELKKYFENKEVVVKPDGGYGGKGLMIKPSVDELYSLFQDDRSTDECYVQEFCPTIEVPHYDFEQNKIVNHGLIKVRSFIIDKKCVGMRGYAHAQQLPDGYSYILPTIVVEDDYSM